MTKKNVLITGATGVTGGHALKHLIRGDLHVRALVRRKDDRAKALEKMGVEICTGDISNSADVGAALSDIDRAYFVYPIRPGLVSAAEKFAEAAQAAGVQYIVNMSQISARQDATSQAALAHWLAERVLDRSGIAVTHLRPTFFAEWMTRTAPMLARGDTIYLPFGGGFHAPITGADQGRVIAALLASPDLHSGKTYTLVGRKEMAPEEMVTELGKVLGRDLNFQQISATDFCVPIKQQIQTMHPDASDADLIGQLTEIDFLAQHLTEVAKDYAKGMFGGVNTTVEDVTGVPAQSLEAFYRENLDMFRRP